MSSQHVETTPAPTQVGGDGERNRYRPRFRAGGDGPGNRYRPHFAGGDPRRRLAGRTAAALLAALTAISLAGCSGDAPEAQGSGTPPPATKAATSTPSAGGDATGESAGAAAEWLAQNLVDGSHAEVEYDGDKFTDAGLTIDVMWALVAVGDLDAARRVADWLALRDTAIDYAGDGEQAAYPSAMGKLALAYLTPGVQSTPEYKSAQELAASVAGRLKPEGRFRDISEWGDNSTPAGQAFGIMLLVKLGMLDGLSADPVAGLVGVACEDGSYPSMFDTDPPCTGDVDTTAIVLQALLAAGQPEAADRAVAYLLAAQTESGRWQSFGADSVNSTALAVSALSLVDTPEAKDAAALGLETLRGWQLPKTAALPAADGAEGDLRATAQGVLGLTQTSYLDLLDIPPK
ncbi:MAG: terpene cyclase/mutase family protein [Bifidobacteriaceae bacterium]|jgi:hypothetical protein|nr:terpene cyclase/mutase family protein [Bifidobacteriaceae bacterium]